MGTTTSVRPPKVTGMLRSVWPPGPARPTRTAPIGMARRPASFENRRRNRLPPVATRTDWRIVTLPRSPVTLWSTGSPSGLSTSSGLATGGGRVAPSGTDRSSGATKTGVGEAAKPQAPVQTGLASSAAAAGSGMARVATSASQQASAPMALRFGVGVCSMMFSSAMGQGWSRRPRPTSLHKRGHTRPSRFGGSFAVHHHLHPGAGRVGPGQQGRVAAGPLTTAGDFRRSRRRTDACRPPRRQCSRSLE